MRRGMELNPAHDQRVDKSSSKGIISSCLVDSPEGCGMGPPGAWQRAGIHINLMDYRVEITTIAGQVFESASAVIQQAGQSWGPAGAAMAFLAAFLARCFPGVGQTIWNFSPLVGQ